MLCARAILTAGPGHKRYKPGTVVRAWVFARAARHPRDLRDKPQLKALASRGWTRITFNGHKVLADDHEFSITSTPEAEGFRSALHSGISIVVLGLVQ